MPNIEIREFSDLDSFTIASVEYFVGLHDPPNKQTFLVPGGQTPFLFYKHLAKAINDWAGKNLLLSDERLVPEKNNMSNVGMVKKQFFDFMHPIYNMTNLDQLFLFIPFEFYRLPPYFRGLGESFVCPIGLI